MKTTLLFILSLIAINLSAQNPPRELKIGAGLNPTVGNGLGLQIRSNVQLNQWVYSGYFYEKHAFLNPSPTHLRSNIQGGILAGYDVVPAPNTTISVQGGVCFGEAVWRGNQIGTKEAGFLFPSKHAVYEEEKYSYVGIPMSLSLNWYFCRYVGLNFTTDVILQPHIDYSIGFGMVLGYFGKKGSLRPDKN